MQTMGVKINFLVVLLLFGTLANCNRQKCLDLKLQCKCQAWRSCDWSEKLVNQITELPKSNPSRPFYIDFFQKRICDFKTRDVYCCNGKNYPSDAELNVLTNPCPVKPDYNFKTFTRLKAYKAKIYLTTFS